MIATINGSRCVEGKVRLTNGSSDSEGNVEICYDGYWGAVCENTFGIFDGRVVCRQLGYRDGKAHIKIQYTYYIIYSSSILLLYVTGMYIFMCVCV